jgi:serine/threonine-protein kinase
VQVEDGIVGRALGPPGHQYRVIEPLGRGGMGVVYRATQVSLLREVAIKVLHPNLAQGPSAVQRFQQEAEGIAHLEHANILPVYDFGEDGGLFYLVMRLVKGGTLRDRFEWDGRRPWPPLQALALARQILPALDYAHQAGVVHRDVKPTNILMEGPAAYLADFGIAKFVQGSGGPSLSGDGLIGTPTYMAPEQVFRDPQRPIDGRADLYAFGVVLYELVTGEPPFKGDHPLEVALQRVHTPAPPARQLNPQLPEPLEAALAQALAKDPDARFASGAAFATALAAAIGQDTAPASPPGAALYGTFGPGVSSTPRRPETPADTIVETAAPPVTPAPLTTARPVPAPTPPIGGRGRWLVLLAGAGLLLLALQYRSLPFPFLGGQGEDSTPAAASATAAGQEGTPVATAQPVREIVLPDPQRTARPGDTLLADTFEEPARTQFLWPAPDDPATHQFRFDGGEFVVQKLAPTSQWLPVAAVPGDVYGDTAFALDAHLAGDPAERYVTLDCRASFEEGKVSAYRLSVQPSARQFWLGRLDKAEAATLVSWRPSTAIRSGNAPNHLELICQGSTITVSINGTQVAQVQDGRYREGRLLLGTGIVAPRQGQAEARFDNVVVLQK